MNGAGKNRHPNLRLVADPSASGRARVPVDREDPDALVAASLSGDREALGDLVAGNDALVLAVVRRYARTPDDAADLARRAFVRAARAATKTLRRDPERALAFRRSLLRSALSVARDHVRREGRRARARLELGPPDAQARFAPGANAAADRTAAIRDAVLKLPRRAREVLTLVLDAELRTPEIAEILGITAGAAKANLRKATLFLRGTPASPKPAASCRELAASLPLRAVGELERVESVRVECHLAGCGACCDEASRIAEALAAASLAPPSPAERRALDDLPAHVLAAFRREPVGERVLSAMAATAVVATFALALFGR